MRVLVTGGAGFIGSAVCRLLVGARGVEVVNVDKLTYAANLRSLDPIAHDRKYKFVRADICDRTAVDAVFETYRANCGTASRGRESCRSLNHWCERFYRNQYSWELSTARGGARLLMNVLRPIFAPDFVLCTCRPMRFMALLAPTVDFMRCHLISQVRLIPPARQPPIIWRTHGTRLMDCP